MKVYGITGNIGCGKSTVVKMLAEKVGVLAIDCDQLAKDIISESNIQPLVSKAVGENPYSEDGVLDKAKLAEIIFSDEKKKTALGNIIYPIMWDRVDEQIKNTKNIKICLVESAILVETKSYNKFNALIVVLCNTAEQLRRLRVNRNMSYEDISQRMKNQISQAVKEEIADFTIRTDVSWAELDSAVSALYQKLI